MSDFQIAVSNIVVVGIVVLGVAYISSDRRILCGIIVFAEIIAINLCDTAALFDIPQFTAGLFENMLLIAARCSADDDFSRGI